MTTQINTKSILKGLRGNVKIAVESIITKGFARTGSSGYSGGYANRTIITHLVVTACAERGILVESGNDAPRGGANGEYVRLVSDKRKNRAIHASISASKAEREARVIAEAARKIAEQDAIETDASRIVELAREINAFDFSNCVTKADRHNVRTADYSRMSREMKARGMADLNADFFKVMNRVANIVNG